GQRRHHEEDGDSEQPLSRRVRDAAHQSQLLRTRAFPVRLRTDGGKPFTCWDNYTMMKVTWRPPGLGNTAAELRGASEHQLHRVHGEQESEDVRPDADGKGVTHLFDAHGTEVHGEHVERRLGAPLDDGGHQPYLGVGAVAGEKLAHGAQGSRARKRAQQGERKYFPWNAD